MINYVNNAYDKVLKPCDAQRFSIIVNSQETERRILGHRGGDAKAKSKLPALIYMGVLDKEKYRKYLDQCRDQGTQPQGSRKAEFMRPTGLLMLDFDHIGRPIRDGVTLSNAKSLAESHAESQREILHSVQDDRGAVIDSPMKMWEQIYKGASERGLDLGKCLALAHITPSGDGLRLVVTRDKGKTIAEGQYHWVQEVLPWLGVNVKCDDVCKDISRLSFAPMKKEILYFNPSLLFGELPEAGDYPNNDLFETPSNLPLYGEALQTSLPTNQVNTSEVLPIEGELSEGLRGSWDESYNGVPYSEIVSRLEEQLGGRPAQGARNSFIFTMACNLRYICNDDAQWVASILPTYGEEPQKHRMTIQSAINRPMSRTMPDTLARALNVAKLCSEADPRPSTLNPQPSGAPALPSALPAPIALLTSRTPDKMKAAVAMAVFPPLGAHLYETEFMYIDNRPYEATFMNLVMAELSSGKSAVNLPIEYIIADMKARDLTAREREREWKQTCATASNAKDKPKRPDGLAVQVLTPDMTNAAFVQRLADAKGRFLYTQMDEIELLDALKTGGRAGAVSQIIRLAFDRGMYGQERVGATSVNEQVQVRWNWNASTTVQRGRSYLRHSLADGTLSRISFATIIRDEGDWGRTIPRFGTYGEPFARELQPYIDALNVCRGTIRCPEAEAWAERMLDEQLTFAEMSDDRAYAQLSFRAVLMGFLRAMTLYVMCGMQWTEEIGEFAAWTVRYDMWCKMRFFGDLLHQDLEAEAAAGTANPRNLLDLLPREFTRQMAQDLRTSQGRKPNPRNMLAQWVHRGYILYDEARAVYVKVKE